MRLSFGEWLSSSTRAELGIGYERERSRGEWLALGAALERRLASDVVSFRAEASHWFSMGAAQPFDELGASIVAASGSRSSIWFVRARLDGRFVTEHAPLATWPGAGSDGVRPYLLRGYPLVEDGVVTGEGFGPRLVHASVEVERTVFRAGIVKVGVAGFVDWAHVPGRSHELRDRSPRRGWASDSTSSAASCGWTVPRLSIAAGSFCRGAGSRAFRVNSLRVLTGGATRSLERKPRRKRRTARGISGGSGEQNGEVEGGVMPDEIPISKKSTDDAKERTERAPRAVEKARGKVRRHIERGKPKPSTEHVDSAPSTDPSE